MTPIFNERDSLLGNMEVANGGQELDDDDDSEHGQREFVPLGERAWSFTQSRRLSVATAPSMPSPQISVGSRTVKESAKSPAAKEQAGKKSNLGQHYASCFVFAVINVIIAVPSLFGYAAVIFNHPIFANHMNALSKCK
jgi:hypothetical protein